MKNLAHVSVFALFGVVVFVFACAAPAKNAPKYVRPQLDLEPDQLDLKVAVQGSLRQGVNEIYWRLENVTTNSITINNWYAGDQPFNIVFNLRENGSNYLECPITDARNNRWTKPVQIFPQVAITGSTEIYISARPGRYELISSLANAPYIVSINEVEIRPGEKLPEPEKRALK